MEFYHLNGSQFAERVEMIRGQYSTLDNSYCHECLDVYPFVEGVDLHIKGRLVDVPLTMTGDIMVGIVHQSLVKQIGEGIFASLFHIGRVFNHKEAELTEYRSFRGKNRLAMIRGNRHSINNKCEQCGRRVYIPMGEKGEVYLLEAKLPRDPVCYSNWNQLILERSTYDRIDWSYWKKKPYIVELPIRDVPLDGINEIF